MGLNKMDSGRHCKICGAPISVGRLCNRCHEYYCHWIYRAKKERGLRK